MTVPCALGVACGEISDACSTLMLLAVAAIGGVTVSAKPAGGTVTTTVFTDAAGDYHFPPLPAGKYRVWAQALSFETARGEVDLGAARHQEAFDGRDDHALESGFGDIDEVVEFGRRHGVIFAETR